MKNWSKKEIEKVKSAHAECMELMGKYAAPSVLNIVVQGGIFPSPDEVISIMYKSTKDYLDHMLISKEAKHQIKEGPYGVKVSCHYVVKRNWYKRYYDIPEHEYQNLDLAVVDWLADSVFREARKDAYTGGKSDTNKRNAITWDYVKAAVDTVDKRILAKPKDHLGQGYEITFEMIADELKKVVDTSKSGLYRWLRDDPDRTRTRKDVYKLLSSEAHKVIKNIN